MADRGNIEELFDSIQGEGPLVGCRQVFIRTGGCNQDCAYCDTPQARRPVATCRVEIEPGSGKYEYLPNPLPVEEVMRVVGDLWTPRHHSIAVTGGEPLTQPGFLRALFPELEGSGRKVYLETNSTCPGELDELVRDIEYIAADIKLSSCTGQPNRFDDNLQFLEKCEVPHLFVKLVVTDKVDPDEFMAAIDIVKQSGRSPIIVIQPVVSRRGDVGIGAGALLKLQQRALEEMKDVRIIPRVHQLIRLS